MDKPISMSVKEYLIRKMSSDMIIDESIIKKVVEHQFVSALEAMKTKNTIEISGFGKFYYNNVRANRMLTKRIYQRNNFSVLMNVGPTERKRKAAEMKYKDVISDINAILPHIQGDDRFQQNIRRLAQPPPTTWQPQRSNKRGEQGEDGDMQAV